MGTTSLLPYCRDYGAHARCWYRLEDGMRGILIPGVSGIATLVAAVTLMAVSAPGAPSAHPRQVTVSTVSYVNR